MITLLEAVEAGDPTAQFALGTQRRWDASCAKTEEQGVALERQAVRLFAKAAAQGLLAAHFALLFSLVMEPASWPPLPNE